MKRSRWLELREPKQSALQKLSALTDTESGYAVLNGVSGAIIVCHGTQDGGLSISVNVLDSIKADEVYLICCYPAQVQKENRAILQEYGVQVVGQWETISKYRLEDGGILVYEPGR